MKPRRYEVKSSLETARQDLQPRERERVRRGAGIDQPEGPRARAIVAGGHPDPRAIVRRALDFFQTQRFRYSLSPAEYNRNDLEEFLFRRRIGFCEHYAASFATLMRLAGVPARVVVGYLGGEFNEMGHFYPVRQSDTHAWCEVWLPVTGWTRVDPTNVVAPERVNLGFESFLERSASAGEMSSRVHANFCAPAVLCQDPRDLANAELRLGQYAFLRLRRGGAASADERNRLPDLRPVSSYFLSAIIAAGFVVILRPGCKCWHALTPIPFRAFTLASVRKRRDWAHTAIPPKAPSISHGAPAESYRRNQNESQPFPIVTLDCATGGRWIPPCCIDSLTRCGCSVQRGIELSILNPDVLSS